jgi:membrane protein implicated in regulation of membrane protease activity
MSESTLWWLAAGLLVAVELATGTFYLLMLSLGLAAAALAAHLGADLTVQFVCVALVGGGSVIFWHLKRQRDPGSAHGNKDPATNLDVGQRVHVSHWRSDGTARVQYRGSLWTARLQEPASPGQTTEAGDFLVRAVDGNELLLGR